MKKSVRISLAAAGVFLLLGMGLWFVPGVKFSAQLCVGIAAALVLWAVLLRWAEKSRSGKICKGILLAFVLAGFVGFCSLELLLVTQGTADNSDRPSDAVIVLGAGVNGTVPSLALATRIDVATDYLEAHPDVPAILSGGQGPGEDITEARAMYDALTKRGIEPGRLILEERSTSTAENFRYSGELLVESGMDMAESTIAVVTNDFHCFRAGMIARRAGLTVFELPAELPWKWLSVNYYVREAFALVKSVLFD